MSTRRYSDDEVAVILKSATEAGGAASASSGSGSGLSLAELQSIGREAGIAPEAIARAARELDYPATPVTTRLLGLPIGVAQSVQVARKLSDDDWTDLVGAARHAFHASGRAWQDGGFREWRNGNLRLRLEPTGAGDRITLQTQNGNARSMIWGGGIMTAAGIMLGITSWIGPTALATSRNSGWPFLMLAGAAMFAYGSIPLGGWAKRRREQFSALIARVRGEPEG